jgi:hypothetical protein
LYSATTTSQNVAIGYSALYSSVSSGGGNVAVGRNAGLLTTGVANAFVGLGSGYYNTSGNFNTYIGYTAGNFNNTGSNNSCIGSATETSTSSVSNQITLGDSSITSLRCQVTSITSLSDQRDKTNIQPMPSVLSFIASLNPVRFDWWMRDGGKIGVPDFGFIAQELQQAQNSTGFDWAQLVYEDNPEKLEASPGKLIPILVKAIQELTAKVAALEAAV